MYKTILVTALSLFYSGLSLAQEAPVIDYRSVYAPNPFVTSVATNYPQLSEAAAAHGDEFTKIPKADKAKAPFEEDWLTANKIHKYLGIGSITLAILAAIAPKPTEEDLNKGYHRKFAEGAAVLGGAAVATGLMFHHDDIFNYGMSDPDNLHATYATLGAIGFALAVSDAPAAEHAGYGILGAVLMSIGIKYTW